MCSSLFGGSTVCVVLSMCLSVGNSTGVGRGSPNPVPSAPSHEVLLRKSEIRQEPGDGRQGRGSSPFQGGHAPCRGGHGWHQWAGCGQWGWSRVQGKSQELGETQEAGDEGERGWKIGKETRGEKVSQVDALVQEWACILFNARQSLFNAQQSPYNLRFCIQDNLAECFRSI